MKDFEITAPTAMATSASLWISLLYSKWNSMISPKTKGFVTKLVILSGLINMVEIKK